MRDHRVQVIQVANSEHLAEQAEWLFRQQYRQSITVRGRLTVALSGGRTPRGLYERLAVNTPPGNRRSQEAAPQHSNLSGSKNDGDNGRIDWAIDWERVHLFQADERYVPKDAEASNYRLIQESLLRHVPIPAEHVHRVHTESESVEMAAARYHDELADFFEVNGEKPPRLDLVVLGLGGDGHIASLFPGSEALTMTNRFAASVPASLTPAYARVTVTPAILQAARSLMVLVSGAEKAAMVGRLLKASQGESESCYQWRDEAAELPVSCLESVLDRVTWVIDAEAMTMVAASR